MSVEVRRAHGECGPPRRPIGDDLVEAMCNAFTSDDAKQKGLAFEMAMTL